MKNQDGVDVVIPTWNREKELNKVLDSIINQKKKINKIIIIDDGSTDNTRGMIERLNIENIKYIQYSNTGLPAVSRNRGLNLVESEYVAFCDSDDYWFKNKTTEQVQFFDKEIGMVCSNAKTLNSGELYIKSQKNRFLTTVDLLENNLVICSSVIIKRDLIRQFGGFDESKEVKAMEDYLLWLKYSLHTKIFYINDPMLTYTDDSSNSVRNKSYVSNEKLRLVVLFKFLKYLIVQGRILLFPVASFYIFRSILRMFKLFIRKGVYGT